MFYAYTRGPWALMRSHEFHAYRYMVKVIYMCDPNGGPNGEIFYPNTIPESNGPIITCMKFYQNRMKTVEGVVV